MKKSNLCSLRLGFSRKEAAKIEKLGLEKFIVKNTAFRIVLAFSGAIPAVRFNLLCRTPSQKDFHFHRG